MIICKSNIIEVTDLDEDSQVFVKPDKVKIVSVHHTAVARTLPRPGRGRRRRLLAEVIVHEGLLW